VHSTKNGVIETMENMMLFLQDLNLVLGLFSTGAL